MSTKNQLTAEQIQQLRDAIEKSGIDNGHKKIMLRTFNAPQKPGFFISDNNVLTLLDILQTLLQVKQNNNEDYTKYADLTKLVRKQLNQPELHQPAELAPSPSEPELPEELANNFRPHSQK